MKPGISWTAPSVVSKGAPVDCVDRRWQVRQWRAWVLRSSDLSYVVWVIGWVTDGAQHGEGTTMIFQSRWFVRWFVLMESLGWWLMSLRGGSRTLDLFFSQIITGFLFQNFFIWTDLFIWLKWDMLWLNKTNYSCSDTQLIENREK